jgi:3-methyladenine DNA glycosylase/8-oxoguanine DNA glycosylase
MRGDPVTGHLDECSCGASAVRREQKLQYRAEYACHVAAMFARHSTKRLCETLRLALAEKASAADLERAGYVLAELQRRKERLAAAP